jgi:hypothetical protein
MERYLLILDTDIFMVWDINAAKAPQALLSASELSPQATA